MAFAHFGQAAHVLLELAQGILGLALERDQGKDHDRIAKLGRIKIGVITADDARFLQRAHPAQAGRRGQPDPLGQLDVGDAPFVLQFGQKPAIDRIQICHAPSNPPCPSEMTPQIDWQGRNISRDGKPTAVILLFMVAIVPLCNGSG